MFRRLSEVEGDSLIIFIDGKKVAAQSGESVAAVLLREDSICARSSPLSGEPRAPYCMMGVCFDCLAKVDGQSSIQTCLVPVVDGMRVERQDGRANLVL